MRMMMKVSIPCEAGNAAIKNGTLASTIQKILGDFKPEAVYFTADGGERTGFIFFDLQDVSQIPGLAEPWFLAFSAKVSLQPAMSPQDLAAAVPAIEEAVKSYATV